MSDANIRITTSGLRAAQRGFSDLKGAASSLGGMLAGIGGGVGVAFGAKAILDFNQTLGALQRDSGLSTDKMMALREQILGLNSEFGIGKEEIGGVLKVFQDLGGNLKAGIRLMPELTMASKATGASMDDLGTIAASLTNAGKGPEEVMLRLRQMASQAEAGTINMRQLASVGAELVGMSEAKGIDFADLVTSLQTVGQVVPNVQDARTALKSMFAMLTQNEKKIGKLSAGGKRVNVFETITDTKTGAKKKVMRNVKDLMGDILKATKQDPIKLQELFGADAGKAVDAFMLSFDKKTGKVGGTGSTFGKVEKAAAQAPEDFFNQKIATLATGIDSEGEKLRQSMARAESYFQTMGQQLVGFVGSDPAGALKTALGGAALLKFGPALAQAAFGLGKFGKGLGPAIRVLAGGSGLGAASKALLMKGGLVAAAGAAGYALGTLIDNTFGFSDALSKSAFALFNTGPDKAANEKASALASLKDQASALAGLGKSGVKTFGAEGAQKALNQQTAIDAIMAQAKLQGVTQAEMNKLMPELLAILKTGMNVTIKGDVLQTPKVVAGGGPAQ